MVYEYNHLCNYDYRGTVWFSGGSMICKKCNILFQHELVSSGDAHPKSFICPVCDTIHDDNGKLFDPEKPRGANTMTQEPAECPNCRSTDIIKQVYLGTYICRRCRVVFS